jgi:predicted transcriptional regulator
MKFKRFYINGNGYRAQLPDTPYKETIGALKNPTARALVQHLLDHPGDGQKEVAEALGMTASTINWHVKRLEEAGLVIKVRDGKHVIYTLKDSDIARKALAIAASEGGQA